MTTMSGASDETRGEKTGAVGARSESVDVVV